MSRTLRIFAKDARHLWPEILLSLALVAVFVATRPFGWPRANTPSPRRPAPSSLPGSASSSQLVALIARSVHDDPLSATASSGPPAPLPGLASSPLNPLRHRLPRAPFLHRQAHPSLPCRPLPREMPLLGSSSASSLPASSSSFLSSRSPRSRPTSPACSCGSCSPALSTSPSSSRSTALSTPPRPPLGPQPFLSVAAVLPPSPACIVVIFLQYARRSTFLSRAILLGTALVSSTQPSSVIEHTWTPHRAYPDLAPNEPPPLRLAPDPNPPSFLNPAKSTDAPGLTGLPDAHGITLPVVISGIASNHAVLIDQIDLD